MLVKNGHRKVYIRYHGINRHKIQELKEEVKEKGTLVYMVDSHENKREIYSIDDHTNQ